MPVYLIHGFRWLRDGFTGIRVHAIVHNLEDCSVEYIQNEGSRTDLLSSFRKLYPEQMKWLENTTTGQTLEFLEQYDPDDEFGDSVVSQPYAFVGDRVIVIGAKAQANQQQEGDRKDKTQATEPDKPTTTSTQISNPPSALSSGYVVKPLSTDTKANPMITYSSSLSVNLEEITSSAPAVTPQAWEALAEIRDKIAEGQKIGWWVVYNGDPERAYDESDDDNDDDEEGEGEDVEESEDVRDTPVQAGQTIFKISASTRVKDKALPNLPGSQPSNVPIHTKSSSQSAKAIASTSLNQPQTGTASTTDGGTVTSKTTGTIALPAQKKDNTIHEPARAKEVVKKEGLLRKKFFGKREKP